MLVRLVENDDGFGNPVLVRTLSYSADETTDSGTFRSAKIRKARKLVTDNCDNSLQQKFAPHIPHILTEELEYVAWAFVEHSRLTEEELIERRSKIEEIILEIMGPADDPESEECLQRRMADHMTQCEFLYPSVCLEMTCRVFCSDQLACLPDEYKKIGVNRGLLLRRPYCNVDPDSGNHAQIKNFVVEAINYLSFEELAETGNAVAQILRGQGTYKKHVEKMLLMFSQLHQIPFMRRRGQALRAMAGADYVDYKEALDDLWAAANEEHQKYYADQLRIIHRMIDSNLPTQPIAKDQGDLLRRLRDTAEEESLLIIQGVRQSVQEDLNRQQELQAALTQRMIAALLADIEDNPKPQRKTGQKTRRKKTRRLPQKKTSNKGQIITSKVIEPDVRDNPIPGLKTYLDFVSNELKRLKSRLPDDQDNYSKVFANIDNQLSDIQTLLDSDEVEAEPYVGLARSSDQFLTTIRAEISHLEEHQHETTAFEKALRLAVQKENIVYGRNNGGRLRRGLGDLTWSDVSDRFHNKMLRNVAEIEHVGTTRFLMEDEALAYYVTMSSTSGYDFNISCHYWRRRPGSNAPPTDEDGFMITNEWYDTYVPCFVLHVP